MSAKITALNINSGRKQPPLLLRRGRVTLGFDTRARTRELRHDPDKYRLEVIYDGHNVIVVDHGSPDSVAIAGKTLVLEAPHIWLADQDLRIGDTHLVVWEDDRGVAVGQRKVQQVRRRSVGNLGLLFSPHTWRSGIATLFHRRFGAGVQFFSPLLMISLFLTLFGLVGWFLFGRLNSDQVGLQQVATSTLAVTMAPSATPTRTETIQATATPQPVVIIPTVARVQPVDNTPPTKVVEVGAAVTPTPAPCQTPSSGSRSWDQRLDELGGIEFRPACVRPGEAYWRLVVARWFDATESQGYHHIFIDLLDEDGNRMLEPTVSAAVSWPNGRCQPQLEDRTEPVVHSLQCAMFTPGSAYNVYVQGLPSDTIRGLGLGSIERRDWGVLTSFYLQFRRTIFTPESPAP